MNQMSGFTRQETIHLTGCTSSRLAYLEKLGLIIPERFGNNGRPTVVFSWEQLLEIRAIKHLRKDVSLQTVRKIIKFLDDSGYDNSLRDKQLVIVGDEVFWMKQDWSDFSDNIPKIVKVSDKRNRTVGQYMLLVIPPLTDIVNDIWEAAEKSKLINFKSFQKRAKALPV